MKKFVVLIAGLTFMATSAFASIAAQIEVAQKATSAVGSQSAALTGIGAGVLAIAEAQAESNDVILKTISVIAKNMKKLSTSSKELVGGMTKVESMDFLSNSMAALIRTADDPEVVRALVTGIPFRNVTGQKVSDDKKLDKAQLLKVSSFFAKFSELVEGGEKAQKAGDLAAESIGVADLKTFIDACGSGGLKL